LTHAAPIKAILESRLIACVASLPPTGEGHSLGLETTKEIISETRCPVFHAPLHFWPARVFSWSFGDLCESLLPKKYYVLANTSRARNANEAVERALLSKRMFSDYPHRADQTDLVIKLEVLDDRLNSINSEVTCALDSLVCSHKMTVIPMFRPDIDAIRHCHDLGLEVVRVQTGRIGSMAGINDPGELRELVFSSPLPLIFEGGLGNSEHVSFAFELGAGAVLLNTAFRRCSDPISLARRIRAAADRAVPNRLIELKEFA
jgi:thiazole synthase ThiGH ThiG subunit